MTAVSAHDPARASAHRPLVSWKTGWGRALSRMLSLMLVLQLCGVCPLVSALAGREEAGCSERCANDDEPQGTQCPPSCPDCTCVHAAWSGLPAVNPPSVCLGLSPVALLVLAFSTSPHSDPSPTGIFHPPRG